MAPNYLQELVSRYRYQPSRSLRSSQAMLLRVPKIHTACGLLGFSSAAATVWNSFPLEMRSLPQSHDILNSFKKQLKTHLFIVAHQ